MTATRIAIIDSGGANIASLEYALQRLGYSASLTSDAQVIQSAERVILPGVGAARNAMEKLHHYQLVDTIRSLEQPVLGICLGMQLLAEASEEEDVDCLGLIPGVAAKLPASPDCPVPNMGWCPVQKTADHEVLGDTESGDYFYFVHSYALPVSEDTLVVAEHAEQFAAVTANDNFVAAQFHPERSSAAGSRFLQQFLRWQQ
ncbi:MAG: imidazole glycerol phosphate synthase subunit HisH [Woeseiaceae bacterium]